MRGFKYILFTLALTVSASVWGQYNPTSPDEPGAPVTTYALTLAADPSGGGNFNLNATSAHQAGETFWLQANTATNFTFVSWTLDDEVVSTTYRFQYTMPAHDVKLIAHYRYTPGSPTEPSAPDIPAKPVYAPIYLTASPAGGGSFNISNGNSYEVGTVLNLRATAATNFRFVNWTQDGEVISTSYSFNYTILEGTDANRLTAHFSYEPGSPGEPAEPAPKKVYHRVYLLSDPAGGGYFNVTSGNEYEEGTKQTFRAYNNEWYTFQNWTDADGEVVSTNSSLTITIPTEDVTLTAHYTYNYNPGSPNEPGQATGKLSLYGMTENGYRSQTIAYPVYLENPSEVQGVTVVLTFPEGFTVNSANTTLAERAAGHSVSVTAMEGNAYRFDVTGDQPFTGQNGKVFEVPVTISEDAETDSTYQVALSVGARINADGSKDMIGTRNGYIYVEEVKEDGLYASFTYDKLQNRMKFQNQSSDKAVSWTWDFGDGTTSTERDPLHIYQEAGYYDVTLTVKGHIGTDVAMMTVLINDESTWRVNGTFFLDGEGQGLRTFATAQELFTFMAAHPIDGNLTLLVEPGKSFDLDLTANNIALLTTIQGQLADGGYTLTIAADGESVTPVLNFGSAGSAIDADVVQLFIALGRSLVCDDVQLQLWGIGFNPSKIATVEQGQTVLSGSPTESVDFSPISQDLTFTWTATPDVDTATGYPEEGTGAIPSMTATSGSAYDAHLIYNIAATYGNESFCELTHTITLRPALEGSFTDMTPADSSQLETTTVTLSWNSITNAVYDVYLWNAANQRPAAPVAEGISDLSYTSRNFCQNMKSYKWQVIARNSSQQIASDTLHFSIKMLPDLHVTALSVLSGSAAETDGYDMEAGRPVTIQWTVRNDGDGSTMDQSWQDRLWLVPDVYAGTGQTSCKLLATVPNVRTLAPGQQYTGQAEVVIDESQYGSYYLLVAADMSSVTSIDWAGVGGTIVNPYAPALSGSPAEDTYGYLMATTLASGNQVEEHGESATRSDNFFYRKVEIAMPTMDEADWNQLKAIYADMGNGEGWTRTWNFDVERRTVQTLPGVSIRQGRVVSIDLSKNGLTGTFPYSLLTMPALTSLNVSGNSLTGDIGTGITAFLATVPDGSSSGIATVPDGSSSGITALNIAGNQLTGNIGVFAQPLTALTTLYAQQNRLQEVNPMIATTVTSLNLGSQTTGKVVEATIGTLTAETLTAQLPTILTYNHQQQAYNKSLNLLCSGLDDWQLQMTLSGGSLTYPYVSEQNAYYGASGDTLAVQVVNSQRTPEGSTLQLKLTFDEGDGNFDGKVNVVDLQAQINFAFEDYNDRPFNFTAANLWVDEVINVQDVVRMTDKLLAITPAVTVRHQSPAASDVPVAPAAPAAPAILFLQDGSLWIDTPTPVAAFEVTLTSAKGVTVSEELKQSGFTCRTNTQDDVTRIVGYSISGATLPVGQTAICAVGQAELVSAVLADANAEEVSVRLIAGETTGIADIVKSQSSNSKWFDLQGRRLSAPNKKGLYIQNGRKVVR